MKPNDLSTQIKSYSETGYRFGVLAVHAVKAAKESRLIWALIPMPISNIDANLAFFLYAMQNNFPAARKIFDSFI